MTRPRTRRPIGKRTVARLAFCLVSVVVEVRASEPTVIRIEQAQLTAIEAVEVPVVEEGRVLEVAVGEGDQVRVGGLLLRLDSAEAELELERSRIELKIATDLATSDTSVRLAQKSAEVALKELRRTQDSERRFPGSVSRTRMDELQLKSDEAQLALEQAQIEHAAAQSALSLKQNSLKLAQLKLERRSVKSLHKAEVVEVLPQAGEWVEAGETIVRLLNRDRLRVEGFLKLSQVTPQLKGAAVTVSLPVAGESMRPFSGRITYVSPEADPNNQQVRFHVEVDNRDGLLFPGQVATVLIELNARN